MNSGIFHSLPFNSSALYYHQTPTRRYGHASTPPRSLLITDQRNMHFHRLWNGMFDRHRAEITVMQFTGASLCDGTVGFLPCPVLSAKLYFTRSLQQTGSRASLAHVHFQTGSPVDRRGSCKLARVRFSRELARI